jgi:hypothetical protein
MPHLPFSSAYPSFAVVDARGAFAISDHDGAFRRKSGPGLYATPLSAVPTTTEVRQASRGTSMYDPPSAWLPESAAFCGTMYTAE